MTIEVTKQEIITLIVSVNHPNELAFYESINLGKPYYNGFFWNKAALSDLTEQLLYDLYLKIK